MSCSVLATPDVMPRFWIFMYRVSPFTYFVSAVLSNGVGNSDITCSASEILELVPPTGDTCQEYLGSYADTFGANLLNNASTTLCKICSASKTNQFLESLNIYYSDRFRNVGILFVYIVFNCFGAVFFYWLARVPKKIKKEKEE